MVCRYHPQKRTVEVGWEVGQEAGPGLTRAVFRPSWMHYGWPELCMTLSWLEPSSAIECASTPLAPSASGYTLVTTPRRGTSLPPDFFFFFYEPLMEISLSLLETALVGSLANSNFWKPPLWLEPSFVDWWTLSVWINNEECKMKKIFLIMIYVFIIRFIQNGIVISMKIVSKICKGFCNYSLK